MATPSRTSSRSTPAIPVANGPDLLAAIESDLQALGRLQPNWDSYGALRINPDTIAAACGFVRCLSDRLARRPRVVPLSTGNLQLEWHDGPRILELEFETPQTIRYLQWDPERHVEIEETFPATEMDKAVELLQWFLSGTGV